MATNHFTLSQSVKTQPAVLALQRVKLDASFCGSRPLDQPHCILSFKQLSNPKLIKNTAHLSTAHPNVGISITVTYSSYFPCP